MGDDDAVSDQPAPATEAPSDPDVAADRAVTDEAPGPVIGRGRAADVYDIGDGRVLRRNRDGGDVAREAAVMRHVAAHGYPVPTVHEARGPDLIMDRVDGPTMLGAFARQPWKLRSWAALLAELHDQLAEIPVPEFELPERFGGREVIVHADLHPENVMLTQSGPIVIDWPNTSLGAPGAEVASTWIIMASSELPSQGIIAAMQRAARSRFVSWFLDAAGREPARSLLPTVAAHRLNDRNLRPGEAVCIHELLEAEGEPASD